MNSNVLNDVVSELDPYCPTTLRNPYPAHEKLRQAGPLIRLPQYGIWAMARFKEVRGALNDHTTFLSGGGVGLSDIRKDPNPVIARRLTLEIDPPDHTKYRAVLMRVLSPLTVRKLRADFAKAAEELVDDLLQKRNVEGAKDVAEAFPMKVFPDAIGIRQEGREHLLRWSDTAFNSFGPVNDIFKASLPTGLAAFEWVTDCCSRENLSPGGLGAMIYEASDKGEIGPDDAPLLVRPLMGAGVDTTVSAIGTMLYGLASHPDQWELLRSNPALARAAFEEAVRWDSPIQSFCRTTSREVEIDGVRVPEGAKIVMLLGAANRDPQRWTDPELYRIERDTQGHVGFGSGIHACVGQMIARLEGEVLLTALINRVKTISLAGAPEYALNNTVRSLARLPLELMPA